MRLAAQMLRAVDADLHDQLNKTAQALADHLEQEAGRLGLFHGENVHNVTTRADGPYQRNVVIEGRAVQRAEFGTRRRMARPFIGQAVQRFSE